MRSRKMRWRRNSSFSGFGICIPIIICGAVSDGVVMVERTCRGECVNVYCCGCGGVVGRVERWMGW